MLGVSAQSNGNVQFGVNAGLSLFKISNAEDGKFKTGLSGGVYAAIPVSENAFVQPEINYQQQGMKSTDFTVEETNYKGSAKLNLSYVNVPVLVKYVIPSTNLGIYVGPQIGFLTTAKTAVDKSDVSIKK